MPCSGRQGPRAWRRLACFRFWRTPTPAEPSWHLAAGSTPPPVPGADQRARGLNRIWDAAGELSLRGAGVDHSSIELAQLIPGEKLYCAKDELWSGPVFFLRSGCRAGKVSSCPGPIPICYGPPSTASPSSAMFLKRLSHCLRPRGCEEGKSR